MKKIQSVLLFIFMLYSCGPEMAGPKYIKYEIVNETDYTVKLIPFGSQGKMENTITTINPHSTFKGKEKRVLPPKPFGLIDVISKKQGYVKKVMIVFNDKKKVEYERCEKPSCSNGKNIFDIEYNDATNISYKITEADYNAATDCNGKCE